MYILIILNTSLLQTFIYLLEPAHPRTIKQLTRTYTTAYSTSHHITNIPHSAIIGNVNAHSTLRHSYTGDHRGQLIATTHTTLNTDTPTRVPNTTLQQTYSPDITTLSNTLYNRTSWTSQHALSSTIINKLITLNF